MNNAAKVLASEVREGMYLDLDGDTYANFFNEQMYVNLVEEGKMDEKEVDRMRKQHDSLLDEFKHEYQFVEAVEKETEDCIRIDCTSMSFGCPPDHKLLVVEIDY